MTETHLVGLLRAHGLWRPFQEARTVDELQAFLNGPARVIHEGMARWASSRCVDALIALGNVRLKALRLTQD